MCQRKNCNSSSHVFILVFLSGSALSYPSAIMRLLAPLFASALLAALALASTAAPQVRIGKWDSEKEFSRGERGFSRALHFSALFSFTRHEAISGLLQGRKLARRTRAGQRKRERSFSVVAATLFERSTCRPCSQGIWSVAAALFPLLAIRILSPPSFFFPRFAKSRGRRLWLRVWERRKSKAKACESCRGKTTFEGFLQGRNLSQVS